jgi:hypothetical protein
MLFYYIIYALYMFRKSESRKMRKMVIKILEEPNLWLKKQDQGLV